MADLLQFFSAGLTIGAVYALVALGFTLIYNASDVINFAQGEFVMSGGMTTVFVAAAGVPLPLAALIAIVAIGMTLAPYVLLRRGSFLRYFATLASLTPLMIYVSVSNAPSILKTVFGATETWKRTPKTRPVASIIPTDQTSRS